MSGRVDMGAYLDLAATAAAETNPDVLAEVSGRIGTILSTMTAPDDRARLQALRCAAQATAVASSWDSIARTTVDFYRSLDSAPR